VSESKDPQDQSLDISLEVTEAEGTDPWIGKQIGKYSVVSRVARGGTATVYRAHDTTLNREVAIKVLHEHLESRPEVVERFKNEARVIASLRHPNIVSVYDFLTQDNHSVLVVEYVPGITLSELIKRYRKIPENFVLMIGLEILQGLKNAHEKGITHRDIKPANILLHPELGVKISDFGLAKLLHSDDGLTKDGIFIGTPSFSSPEQIEGKAIDHRSDLFSLGLSMYMLATGSHAFKRKGDTTTTVWFKIVRGKFQGVRELDPSISADFEKILDRCLQVDLNKRYANAKQIIDDFVAILKKRKIYPYAEQLREFLEQPYGSGSPRASVFKRYSWLRRLGLVLVPVVVLAGLGIFYRHSIENWFSKNQAPTPASETGKANVPPPPSAVNEKKVPTALSLSHHKVKVSPKPVSPKPASKPKISTGERNFPAIKILPHMDLVTQSLDSGYSLRFSWKGANQVFILANNPYFHPSLVESKFSDGIYDWLEWGSGKYYWQAGVKKSELDIEDFDSYRSRTKLRKRNMLVSSEFNDVDLQLNPWTQQIKLSWDNGPNADSYRIEVASDRNFQKIIFSENALTKSAVVERLWDHNQEIYWKVSYLDSNRNVFLVDPIRRIYLKLIISAPSFDILEPRLSQRVKKRTSIPIRGVGPRGGKFRCAGMSESSLPKNWVSLKMSKGFYKGSLRIQSNRLVCEGRIKNSITQFVLPLELQ